MMSVTSRGYEIRCDTDTGLWFVMDVHGAKTWFADCDKAKDFLVALLNGLEQPS